MKPHLQGRHHIPAHARPHHPLPKIPVNHAPPHTRPVCRHSFRHKLKLCVRPETQTTLIADNKFHMPLRTDLNPIAVIYPIPILQGLDCIRLRPRRLADPTPPANDDRLPQRDNFPHPLQITRSRDSTISHPGVCHPLGLYGGCTLCTSLRRREQDKACRHDTPHPPSAPHAAKEAG